MLLFRTAVLLGMAETSKGMLATPGRLHLLDWFQELGALLSMALRIFGTGLLTTGYTA